MNFRESVYGFGVEGLSLWLFGSGTLALHLAVGRLDTRRLIFWDPPSLLEVQTKVNRVEKCRRRLRVQLPVRLRRVRHDEASEPQNSGILSPKYAAFQLQCVCESLHDSTIASPEGNPNMQSTESLLSFSASASTFRRPSSLKL